MASSRMFLVPLLALAALPVSTNAAAPKVTTAIPCYKVDGQTWDYLAQPKTCVTFNPQDQELTPVTLKALKWKSWGAKSATATGKVNAPGYSGPIDVKASGLKRCSAKLSIYAKYTAAIPDRGYFVLQTALPCPKG